MNRLIYYPEDYELATEPCPRCGASFPYINIRTSDGGYYVSHYCWRCGYASPECIDEDLETARFNAAEAWNRRVSE